MWTREVCHSLAYVSALFLACSGLPYVWYATWLRKKVLASDLTSLAGSPRDRDARRRKRKFVIVAKLFTSILRTLDFASGSRIGHRVYDPVTQRDHSNPPCQ
ncbi:hypothetical protein EV356DRAFT_2906 [Viridothelium virens]|uniref:Uncharacterized protein n=1 Tax=Viridothelium virens TaxID=1048519 RepID=A0A6A6HPV0_VIRVR|nr:hypothetical protein EV356DRAFT_2906 [Viridothelium virens]